MSKTVPTPAARAPREASGGQPMSTAPTRELLDAVLDALTLPYDAPDYDRRILDRAAHALTVARAALDEDPADLGWNVDYLRQKIAAEQAAAEARERNRCRRCRTRFALDDTRFDGLARYRNTPWCRRCVDNCHEGSAEHVCPICGPARYGGEPRCAADGQKRPDDYSLQTPDYAPTPSCARGPPPLMMLAPLSGLTAGQGRFRRVCPGRGHGSGPAENEPTGP